MDEVLEGTQQPSSASGSVDSEDPPKIEGSPSSPPPHLLLCSPLATDEACALAAKAFDAVLSATDGAALEALAAASVGAAGPLHVALDDFQGPVFEAAHRAKHRILGRTALLQLAARGEQLPNNARPLFTLAMRGAVICFTGFRKKEELTYLITLIHNMGGSIRKDMSARVTHLIAAASGGEKYRYAVTFRVPIMSRSWVDACWEKRFEIDADAVDEAIMTEHKLKVFAGARVVFVGFAEDERQHMADVLGKNGGEHTTIDDPTCTHVVLANGETIGRSHILSPSLPCSPRVTTSTTKNTLYETLSGRLSERLSGKKKNTPKKDATSPPEGTKLSPIRAQESSESDAHLESNNILNESNFSNFNLEVMHPDKYKCLTQCLEYSDDGSRLTDDSTSEKENSDDSKGKKGIKGLFRKRSTLRMQEETIPESLQEGDEECPTPLTKLVAEADLSFMGSPHLSMLFAPDPDVELDLPSFSGSHNFHTSGLSSGKKRSRNSTDSSNELTSTEGTTPGKRNEETDWKSPFKRLKMKDSFRFKGISRPVMFKKDKKKKGQKSPCTPKQKSKSPRSSDLEDCVTSTPSPKKDDLNSSLCSLNASTAKGDKSILTSSGLFDISFRSLKSSKSTARIRRSVKSITASFRGDKKKRYETTSTSTDDDILNDKAHSSDLEISPLNSTSNGINDLEKFNNGQTSSTPIKAIPLSKKTPLRKAALDFCEQRAISKTPTKGTVDAVFKTPKAKLLHRQSTVSLQNSISPPEQSDSLTLPSVPTETCALTPEGHIATDSNAIARLPLHNRQLLSVVDEHNTTAMPDAVTPKAHVVKAEWFWASVQNEEAQEEKEYLFEDYLEALMPVSRRSSHGSLSSGGAGGAPGTPPSPPRSPGGPSSSIVTPLSAAQQQFNRLRKRKLRGGDSALNKRRSSVGDAVLLSLSGGVLDCTPSPDGKQLLDEAECGVSNDVVRKLMSPRQQVFMELLQTESNYVSILHTIVTMFKLPLEQMTEEENGNLKPLLNNTELKIIFGNLPPIYEIHRRMLEELKWSSQNWSEDISIGRLVLKFAQDMVKAYPPFVNFFENTKEMLMQCDKDKPRFHAFLKICQTKPECGRQSLQELLIRPVQRLPSISLLLEDILKHTHKLNPDHKALGMALASIREVMTYINEDKRKTEGQLQMFELYNEIDNCPPHLVSSHRSFVARCDVVELSKDLSGRGDHLVLFLFTDTMEVCKRKSKSFNTKSPTGANGMHTMSRFGSTKPYRHIQFMPLSTVKRVIDIRETDECHNVFALICRSNQELKEKLYSFTITDELVEKGHFLRQLCRQMANTVCKADADTFLASFESHQLDIDTSDIALGTLSKAFKFASRTRLKVGRAFSFNKTPSKLKRAVSSMISPFGSAANLTPANQLAQMRLQSCTNINELGVSGMGNAGSGNNAIEKPEVLVAPLSVQPQRKAKTASLASGTLRRL